MIEFARDHFGLPRVVVEMFLLAGDFEMAATREIAVDVFFADNLLDAIDGRERRGVHAPRELASVHRDELVHAQLHAGQHHAAVAGTGSPANGFGFEHGDFRAALGESAGGGESGEAGADDGDVDAVRQADGLLFSGNSVVVSQ